MVQATSRERLKVSIMMDKHELLSDVTPDMGGDDEGPEPHQILEAAIASCTAMTLKMYANRKNWDLIAVDVIAQIESEGPENRISCEIKLFGALSQEQKQRLLEIAKKCPIHRLLMNQTQIETRFTEDTIEKMADLTM